MSVTTGQAGKKRREEGVTGPPPRPAKGQRQKRGDLRSSWVGRCCCVCVRVLLTSEHRLPACHLSGTPESQRRKG